MALGVQIKASRGIGFVIVIPLFSVSPSPSFPSGADQDKLYLRGHEAIASFYRNFWRSQSPDWRPNKRDPLIFAFGLHVTESLADLGFVLDIKGMWWGRELGKLGSPLHVITLTTLSKHVRLVVERCYACIILTVVLNTAFFREDRVVLFVD